MINLHSINSVQNHYGLSEQEYASLYVFVNLGGAKNLGIRNGKLVSRPSQHSGWRLLSRNLLFEFDILTWKEAGSPEIDLSNVKIF